ncbi:uncharacterized protein LOC105355960 [Oryzias latipes]|uniref:INO80 complex subunit E n=1 Tax=Oryzias latipes TaxID=8090 RepID=H2MCM9_ORYLA|nr:uncharacterized protein LOC105355960 [Oryzias latipes]
MLCCAAVSAAVWLLAVLSLGLSLPAEHSSEPGFNLCSHCFYRQTPPRGASTGPLPRPRCHALPGGRALATLSRPTCDTAVYSAFHLSHGWAEGEGEEGEEELVVEDEGDTITVTVPALLRGGGLPRPVSSTDSSAQHWDSTVTSLVRSSILPRCSTVGGDVYILTGSGGLGLADDGDERCGAKPLWSAVCCALPDAKGNFSVALVRDTEEGEREVSMKELEQILEVEEIFFEGCGGGPDASAATNDGDNGDVDKTNLDSTDMDLENIRGSEEEKEEAASTASEKVVVEEAQAESSDPELSQQTPIDAMNYVNLDEEDLNSTSTLVYVLSTSWSIIQAPLCPVFSTITELPGQVVYILQEDLGVLSALPGDIFTLMHLLTSDLLSLIGFASEMLLGIGEMCLSSIYNCTLLMMGALLNSCLTGVSGIGTLAGDTVGIFGGALDNIWLVTTFFGEWLWEQTEGYLGTVISETGSQAQAVGEGLGKLTLKTGNGITNVFRLGGGLIMEIVEMTIGSVKEAFGLESQ